MNVLVYFLQSVRSELQQDASKRQYSQPYSVRLGVDRLVLLHGIK